MNLRIINSNQILLLDSIRLRVRFFTKIQIRIFYVKTAGYFVSLLKSKNGLLIQMIHNGGEFFGSYPKPDTLDT